MEGFAVLTQSTALPLAQTLSSKFSNEKCLCVNFLPQFLSAKQLSNNIMFRCEGLSECLTDSEWRCNDGFCIHNSKRCDKDYNCYDHSDELDCGKLKTICLIVNTRYN